MRTITAEDLRMLVADFMQDNPVRGDVHYRDFVEQPDEQSTDLDYNWQRYLTDLRASAWGENIAVQGLCEMLNCNIFILSTDVPEAEPTEITPSWGHGHETVYLGLIGQYHYTALVRNNEGTAEDSSNQDSDEEADNEESRLRGLQYDTCLQPENLQAENNVYSVAPGKFD